MAGSFAAQVRNWSERAKRDADLVVIGATQRVAREMTQPKDGLMRDAPFEEGVVPVDEGQLIGSVIVSVSGTITGRGNAEAETPPDYTASLSGYQIGQTILVGFSAPHSRLVEYGANGVPGRFMTRLAIQNWQQFVDETAALLKD